MAYPGGKAQNGVYQRLINQMPPHSVYLEPFLGGGAVMRYKRPAARNIGLDLDGEALKLWTSNASANYELVQSNALAFLRDFDFEGGELVYCDPPYLHSTRTKTKLYNHECSDDQHRELLDVLRSLSCMVMLSGYASTLYARKRCMTGAASGSR